MWLHTLDDCRAARAGRKDTALGGAARAAIAAGIAVTPVLVEANFDDMKILLEEHCA